MAEAIPFSLATNLLNSLASSVVKEIGLTYGVKTELRKLEKTLTAIKARLLDAEEQQEKSHLIQDWVRKLKVVAYEAEDVVDEFLYKALQRQVESHNKLEPKRKQFRLNKVRKLFSCSKPLNFRNKMAHKIQNIREKLDDIAKDMAQFKFTERSMDTETKINTRDQTHSFVVPSDVIGRDEMKEEIIELLKGMDDQVKVSTVAIVGFGGLGKTTLARLVFNDDEVAKYFDCKLWVSVSDQEFDVESIVRKIIKSATSEELKDLEIEQLQSILREHLHEKKFLLVLDDVWNENRAKWLGLENLLVGGQRGSKVLVTTRSRAVASAVGVRSPYLLGILTEDQSWSLFQNFAFGEQENEVHPKLMEMGKILASRCRGVPLGLKTLGSMLYGETRREKWLAVQNNELWALRQDENDIFPVLRLSYNHLPAYVKQCFACCSLFPKGFRFEKTHLVQFWMAQGYFQSLDAGEDLEDIGNRYFEELLSKSFFDADCLCYKMHDLIHDLAQLVAGGESTSLGGEDTGVEGTSFNSERVVHISERVVHVSLTYDLDKVPSQVLDRVNARTLLFFSGYNGSASELDRSLRRLGSLRVLYIWSLKTEVPASIGGLKHLRYLFLRNENELPNCICDLHQLQTLIVLRCREFPRDFWKLISLRHLTIFSWLEVEHMPPGLGKLSSLRNLEYFAVGEEGEGNVFGRLDELNGLSNLRGKLEIWRLENARSNGGLQAKETNLKVLQHLQCLMLKWDEEVTDENECDEVILEELQPHPKLEDLAINGYAGVKFSSWMMMGESCLPYLVRLEIRRCRRCRQLPSFAQLPLLEVLKLERLDGLEYIDDSDGESVTPTSVFFPSLKELRLDSLPELKGWWRREQGFVQVFPHLSTLNIMRCPMVNSGIPWYPCIDSIYLHVTSGKVLQNLSASIATLPKLRLLEMRIVHDVVSLPDISSLHSLHIIECKTLLPVEIINCKNLNSISIFRCNAPSLKISTCKSLNSLKINSCMDLQSLEISGCESLHSLEIIQCKNLESFKISNYEGLHSLSIIHSKTLIPLELSNTKNLNSLMLYGCNGLPSLKLSTCKSLHSLEITNCMQLQSFEISDCGSLHSLQIDSCGELRGLSGGLFRCLTSLHSLDINYCPSLLSLNGALQHLNSLEHLKIHLCEEIDLLEEDGGMQFQGLRSLTSLHISSMRKLVFLPEGLQNVSTLRSLTIEFCYNLMSLPQWIGNLTSLEELTVRFCSNLTSLPQEMRHLTALQTLSFQFAGPPSELEKKCQRERGEYWPFIAHIPCIRFNFDLI